MTIPRLELCAAVVAVQINQMLRREIDLQLEESVFWTDSMPVLQYIRNKSTRFHTFVVNRLAIIHDGSLSSRQTTRAEDCQHARWSTTRDGLKDPCSCRRKRLCGRRSIQAVRAVHLPCPWTTQK